MKTLEEKHQYWLTSLSHSNTLIIKVAEIYFAWSHEFLTYKDIVTLMPEMRTNDINSIRTTRNSLKRDHGFKFESMVTACRNPLYRLVDIDLAHSSTRYNRRKKRCLETKRQKHDAKLWSIALGRN